MDILSKSLFSVVSQAVDEFAGLVATRYDTSKEEVLELWNDKVSSELKVAETVSATTKKAAAPRTRAKTVASVESDNDSTCSYEFKKGKNIGTKCTAKVCPDSTSFCRKHKTQEGKEETSTTKPEKKSSAKSSVASKAKKADSKEKETAVVKKLNEGKQAIVMHRNKQNNYEHEQTHLVFDRVTKEVYGKQTDDGVEPLSAEDIEQCRKLNFKYRLPTALSSTNEEEEVEEVEEEEEEEVEEEEEEEEVEEEN